MSSSVYQYQQPSSKPITADALVHSIISGMDTSNTSAVVHTYLRGVVDLSVAIDRERTRSRAACVEESASSPISPTSSPASSRTSASASAPTQPRTECQPDLCSRAWNSYISSARSQWHLLTPSYDCEQPSLGIGTDPRRLEVKATLVEFGSELDWTLRLQTDYKHDSIKLASHELDALMRFLWESEVDLSGTSQEAMARWWTKREFARLRLNVNANVETADAPTSPSSPSSASSPSQQRWGARILSRSGRRGRSPSAASSASMSTFTTSGSSVSAHSWGSLGSSLRRFKSRAESGGESQLD